MFDRHSTLQTRLLSEVCFEFFIHACHSWTFMDLVNFCFDCCFISIASYNLKHWNSSKAAHHQYFFNLYCCQNSCFYHLISYILINSPFFHFFRFNIHNRALKAIQKLRTHRDVVHILYLFISITQQTFFPGRGWCYSLRYISKPLAHTYFRYTRSIFHCPLIHSCHVCISNLIFTCHGLEYLSCTILSSFD